MHQSPLSNSEDQSGTSPNLLPADGKMDSLSDLFLPGGHLANCLLISSRGPTVDPRGEAAGSDQITARQLQDASLAEQFGETGHELGMQLSGLMRVEATVVLAAGKILADTYVLYGDSGRGSRYGRWLKTYAPWLDRKTADRWRQVYRAFAVHFEQTSPAFVNLRLTALYLLSRVGVAHALRAEAVHLANNNIVVTEAIARALLQGECSEDEVQRAPKPLPPLLQKLQIAVRLAVYEFAGKDRGMQVLAAQELKRIAAALRPHNKRQR